MTELVNPDRAPSLNHAQSVMNLRRRCAQGLFFLSGACAVLFFGGVETWAKVILGIMLALSCLLEASVSGDSSHPVSRKVLIPAGALLVLIGLSLCPWPGSWAHWLMPGQAYLLRDLEGMQPVILHGSMAPVATWGAFFVLTGAAAVVYLSWSWSSDQAFRVFLNIFIFVLAVVVATLGLIDRLDGNDLLYGIRATGNKEHWGAFINRNHFSNYLNIGIFVGLGVFFRHAFSRRGQKGSWWVVLLTLMGVIFCTAMSLATASKGGLLSLMIGLIVFSLLFLSRKGFGVRARVIVLGLLVFLAFLMSYGRPVLQRTESWFAGYQSSGGDGRWQVWRDTWQMGRIMSGRGIGVGVFETVFPAFQTSQGHKTISHVENEYLQAWVEWGVAGCVIWIVLGAVLISRAVQTLSQRPGEWQIAAWSALVVMAVHAMVDFPFHIPSNAWLMMALIGMLSRRRDHQEEDVVAGSSRSRPSAQRRWGLILLGCALLLGPLALRTPAANTLAHVEQQLSWRSYQSAWQESLCSLEWWPFYWRAHDLAGHSAAGLPSMSREVQRCFHRAQRLGQSNPEISFRAGALFLRTHSVIARDFFETALLISDQPIPLFGEIVVFASKETDGLEKIAPLGLRDTDRWLVVWHYLQGYPKAGDLRRWTLEGAKRWLGDANEQEKIMHALIEGEQAETVLDPDNLDLQRKIAETLCSLSRYGEAVPVWQRVLAHAPGDQRAMYGLATAYEQIGEWKAAADVWKRLVVQEPSK